MQCLRTMIIVRMCAWHVIPDAVAERNGWTPDFHTLRELSYKCRNVHRCIYAAVKEQSSTRLYDRMNYIGRKKGQETERLVNNLGWDCGRRKPKCHITMLWSITDHIHKGSPGGAEKFLLPSASEAM